MTIRTLVPLMFTLVVYLVCEAPAVTLPQSREEEPDSNGVFNVGRHVVIGPTWRTTTCTEHWMLTELPSDWVPAINKTLMVNNPVIYLYGLKEMEANLVSRMLQSSARGGKNFTEEEAQTLGQLLHAYEQMKFLFLRPPDVEPTHKSTTDKVVKSSEEFWSFLRLYHEDVIPENAKKTICTFKQSFPRVFGVFSRFPRHRRMKRLYKLLQAAKKRLLYKWWNLRDMNLIFAMLASVLYECRTSTAEPISFDSQL